MTRQLISTKKQPLLRHLTRSVRRAGGFVLVALPDIAAQFPITAFTRTLSGNVGRFTCLVTLIVVISPEVRTREGRELQCGGGPPQHVGFHKRGRKSSDEGK